MGIGADSTQKAFYSQDIQAFLDRKSMAIPRHFYEDNLAENTRHVCVAVDPAGGGASAFAVCSLVQIPTGGIIVRRHPSLRPVAQRLALPHVRQQHARANVQVVLCVGVLVVHGHLGG